MSSFGNNSGGGGGRRLNLDRLVVDTPSVRHRNSSYGSAGGGGGYYQQQQPPPPQQQYPSLAYQQQYQQQAPPATAHGFIEEDEICSEMMDGFLYMGSNDTATDLDVLQNNGITHVLNMARECPNHFQHIPHLDLVYMRAEMADTPFEEFYRFIPTGVRFVESAYSRHRPPNTRHAVLIHCSAGISRSAAMTVAYLMWKHGYRLNESVRYVKHRRKRTNPVNFLGQLQEFENFLTSVGHYRLADHCRQYQSLFVPQPLPTQLPLMQAGAPGATVLSSPSIPFQASSASSSSSSSSSSAVPPPHYTPPPPYAPSSYGSSNALPPPAYAPGPYDSPIPENPGGGGRGSMIYHGDSLPSRQQQQQHHQVNQLYPPMAVSAAAPSPPLTSQVFVPAVISTSRRSSNNNDDKNKNSNNNNNNSNSNNHKKNKKKKGQCVIL